MRVLFDQGFPSSLKSFLIGKEVSTLYQLGWSEMSNGELIDRAEKEGFDCFVTTDKNLRYQQNLTGREISIVVLPTPSWPQLKAHGAHVDSIVSSTSSSDYIEVTLPHST